MPSNTARRPERSPAVCNTACDHATRPAGSRDIDHDPRNAGAAPPHARRRRDRPRARRGPRTLRFAAPPRGSTETPRDGSLIVRGGSVDVPTGGSRPRRELPRGYSEGRPPRRGTRAREDGRARERTRVDRAATTTARRSQAKTP
mmetsp:Transcript_13751/g.42569  ORF Transcript_13751/g.42569 Transcript_13751/m.42569 type:complete len:145 (-) Transcript_13751:204-638(-)